jgi:hypothetical protein
MNLPNEMISSVGSKPPKEPELKFPDNDEIFAAMPLAIGEDKYAYRRLYLSVWQGLFPRDGYEAELVRQIVNLQAHARLSRLDNRAG